MLSLPRDRRAHDDAPGCTMTDRLLADIGGTHARFAVLSGSHLGKPRDLPVGRYASPEQAIRHFLDSQGKAAAIDGAVIAAAAEAGAAPADQRPA